MTLREQLKPSRLANGEGKCGYCLHASIRKDAPELIVKHADGTPGGDQDYYKFCDKRCHRYFCFLVNPNWEEI